MKHITKRFFGRWESDFKEEMKKFVALVIKEKRKTAMNEWENDDPDTLQALYSGYKILFWNLLVNLFKQRYINQIC